MTYSIRLPFPPSLNNAFPQNRQGRRFPSKAYRLWQKSAWVAFMKAKLPKQTTPVDVHIELFPKDARARDADNYGKPILDALVKNGVLADDSSRYVRSVNLRICDVDKNNPRAEIMITPLVHHVHSLGGVQTLSKSAQNELRRLERDGIRCTSKPTPAQQELIKNGFASEVPSLWPGFVQAVRLERLSKRGKRKAA